MRKDGHSQDLGDASGELLVEGASWVLAVALDLNVLFILGVVTVGAAIFFVGGNRALAHRVGALLVFISHLDFPFYDNM
jgi:hypothetical protein